MNEESVYQNQVCAQINEIVLNQPKKKNAISAGMMQTITRLIKENDSNPEVKVTVIRGQGDNFSSGGDLSQTPAEQVTIENTRATLQPYLETIRAIRNSNKPVIAMADGYVVGGAFSLLLACDLAIVSDRVKVVPAFCAIGIVPEMGMTYFLPKLVGDKLAKEILFTNQILTGQKLVELGIANAVVPAENLGEKTINIAKQIADMPPSSIAITKAMINSSLDVGLDQTMGFESTASPFCTQTDWFSQQTHR